MYRLPTSQSQFPPSCPTIWVQWAPTPFRPCECKSCWATPSLQGFHPPTHSGGICYLLTTMPKDYLGTSPAYQVFGSPLIVPGKFVGHGQFEPVPNVLRCLCDNAADLWPVPPIHHTSPTTSLPTSLFLAKFVFLCCDRQSHTNSHIIMAHFMYWPQGTNSSKFRSASWGDHFYWKSKRSYMLTSLLTSRCCSHHELVTLHTLHHSPLFYQPKSK